MRSNVIDAPMFSQRFSLFRFRALARVRWVWSLSISQQHLGDTSRRASQLRNNKMFIWHKLQNDCKTCFVLQLTFFAFLIFPQQFTVGVLDSILSMSALFRLPCPPFSNLYPINSFHLSPKLGLRCPPFSGLCPFNSLHLSPSSSSDVRPFRLSVLSILY